MDQGRRERRGKVLEKGESAALRLFLDSSVNGRRGLAIV
jgi:hypothetical protein